MNRWILLLVLITVCKIIPAQHKSFTKEITIITDNDNYDLELTDRYYSNGFIIQYNWAAKHNSRGVAKTIYQIEAAHKVYNPYKNNESLELVLKNMDRPYAGWLYGSYGVTKIRTKQHVLQYGVAAGIMGPGALGEEIQQGWHKLVGLYKVYGWEYELKNEPGLNFSAGYYYSLLQSRPQKNISLHTVSRATLGNTFTNASAGVLLKAGWLNSESETGYWGGNLGAGGKTFRRNEFVFFLEPVYQFQGYNATVQGGLFRKEKGPFTTGIKSFVFQTKTGIMYTGNKLGLRWYYTFRGKEGSIMKKAEHWGSIGLSFRF